MESLRNSSSSSLALTLTPKLSKVQIPSELRIKLSDSATPNWAADFWKDPGILALDGLAIKGCRSSGAWEAKVLLQHCHVTQRVTQGEKLLMVEYYKVNFQPRCSYSRRSTKEHLCLSNVAAAHHLGPSRFGPLCAVVVDVTLFCTLTPTDAPVHGDIPTKVHTAANGLTTSAPLSTWTAPFAELGGGVQRLLALINSKLVGALHRGVASIGLSSMMLLGCGKSTFGVFPDQGELFRVDPIHYLHSVFGTEHGLVLISCRFRIPKPRRARV